VSREVHFVIAVDVDEKTVRIDDETFMARFDFSQQVWNNKTQMWELDPNLETYYEALHLLNTRELERD
jgi:hypothetical protein